MTSEKKNINIDIIVCLNSFSKCYVKQGIS